MNSEKRCVGIAAVTEALLEGEQTTRLMTLDTLAQEIYENIATGKQIRFPLHLARAGQQVVTTNQKTLDALSSQVADLYKREHAKLSQTKKGVDQLLAAERNVIRTERELDQLLDADRDHIEFFCCFGSRRFPDGNYKRSYHAVLIARSQQGTKVVYDPNDPGAPLQCKLYEDKEGLSLEWTCKYRETGLVTTQRYQVVQKDNFFRIARGLDSVQSPK